MTMTFTDVLKSILASACGPMTPQEIREQIKREYPEHYGTPSHVRNVAKGHYKSLDHALLAQIYSLVRMNRSFSCDKNHKPVRISLNNHDAEPSPRSKVSYPKVFPKESNARNEDNLITNIGHYYKRSLEVLKEFGGPSIYFHVQSIKEQEAAFLSDRHIEMIYATLASWGMHKMGNPDETKAKLVEYSDFRQSILRHRERLHQFCSLRMDSCTQDQYEKYVDDLEQVYRTLKVSISKATIVAHSKTLAHILPNLIPPIDRQYTVRFFTQENKQFFTKSGKFRLVSLPQAIALKALTPSSPISKSIVVE